MSTNRIKNPEGQNLDKLRPKNSLSLRGRTFIGTVISARMQKTVTVEWERKHFLKKYERYEKRKSKVKAHNPESVNAKEGDVVRIKECRPISKTKNFIVVEVMGKEKGFKERMEAEEESKARKPAKEEKAKEENVRMKPSNRSVGNTGNTEGED
ncbi:30S ribosomal protein S17 [Candidatus Woesearchaeota archaeon]|nr:30S ribosomal protein S17 [Candidatus Woesearchaeota archaeon]